MKKLILLVAVAIFCGTSAMAQSVVEDDEIFVVVENSPEFPGGNDSLYAYIGRNIKYPEAAKKEKIQGRVFVTFVIEKDGQVSSAKILRDIGGGCGEEAIRVVKNMPKWKPGTQRGKPVRVQFNLPIMFQLEKSTSESK
ncbi:MAG: energy transducer TonB [Bacteroidales bacterium]|nr:energy transducer TonB [Bacteroidales bacterium]